MSTTFRLWAPDKRSVHLIGGFNEWNRAADPMRMDDQGWWSTEMDLPPGKHEYQFLIDGEKVVSDPHARAVKDELDEAPIAIVEVGKPEYQWRHAKFARPAFRDLIIYELHVADFSPEGTFQAVIDHLDYLRDLGVNAIQLLPVNEAANDEDWGYQPTFYFAPRNDYGSDHDLKELIDEAHARGIAVILDVVFAHAGHKCPLNQLYAYEQSPWFGGGIGGENQFGLPTFDHRKDATRKFFRDVQNYWLKEFRVDGFRYDYAINIGVGEGDAGMKFLGHEARKTGPGAYLIGEYLPEDPKVAGLVEFDATWHVRWSYAIKALTQRGKVHGTWDWDRFEETARTFEPQREGYERASHMVNYIESHDEGRIVHELRNAGLPAEAARRRLALAATVLLSAPGVPMIYQGQEYGETAPLTVNERNPVNWGMLATRGGRGLLEHYQRLCKLRGDHPALRAEGFAFDAVHNDEKWFVFHRWNEEGDVVVVAANFGDPRKVLIPLPEAGKWCELFSQRIHDVKGEALELDVDGTAAVVLTRAM
jgi:1,4-alpha-glucan branching enzyme